MKTPRLLGIHDTLRPDRAGSLLTKVSGDSQAGGVTTDPRRITPFIAELRLP